MISENRKGFGSVGFVFFLCFVSLFLFSQVSALSNLTLEQQQGVCSSINLTFVECFSLWDAVVNYPTYEAFYKNYSSFNFSANQTIYINITQNQTNCSNGTIYVNQTFDELTKIDEYSKRGFEPVFENGFITNFKKVENCSVVTSADSVLKSQCEVDKSNEYQRGLSSNCQQNTSKDSSSDFFKEYWFIILGLVVVAVLGYLKFGKTLFPSPQAPSRPLSAPLTLSADSPEVPFQ